MKRRQSQQPRQKRQKSLTPLPRWREDLFEWLGDSVLGEVVARVLFQALRRWKNPPPPSLFHRLHDLVVSNRNLAAVYDKRWPGSDR